MASPQTTVPMALQGFMNLAVTGVVFGGEVAKETVDELPFGHVATSLFDRIKTTLDAIGETDALVKDIAERIDRLWEVTRRVAERPPADGNGLSTRTVCQAFVKIMVKLHNRVVKWKNKKWWKKVWNGNEYKGLLRQLCEKLDCLLQELIAAAAFDNRDQLTEIRHAVYIALGDLRALRDNQVDQLAVADEQGQGGGAQADQLAAADEQGQGGVPHVLWAELQRRLADGQSPDLLRRELIQVIKDQEEELKKTTEELKEATNEGLAEVREELIALKDVLVEKHAQANEISDAEKERLLAALAVGFDGMAAHIDAVGDQVDAVGGHVVAVGGQVDAVRGEVDSLRGEVVALMAALQPTVDRRLIHSSDVVTIPKSHITLGKKLGEGGNGVVFFAEWNKNATAVKRLRNDLANDPELRTKLLREARKHARLRHPNIISFYGVVWLDGSAGLVMEFGGCSLYKFLYGDHEPQADRVPEALAVAIALDVAMALEYLHISGMTHRDIKPHNVLVSTVTQKAKLGDFGVAKLFQDRATFSSTKGVGPVGTWGNMAPEVLSLGPGSVLADYRPADVYSFGITGNELFGGGQPWNGYSIIQIVDAVRNGERPAVAPDVCDAIAQLYVDTTQQEPNKRPSASDVCARLRAALRELGGDPRTASPAEGTAAAEEDLLEPEASVHLLPAVHAATSHVVPSLSPIIMDLEEAIPAPETEREPRVLLYYPPCCEPKCTTMRACGEDNSFCYRLGEFGHSEAPFGVPRHKWMYTAAAINTVCLILLIAGACGVSKYRHTMKKFAWSTSSWHDDDTDYEMYVGPSAVLTKYKKKYNFHNNFYALTVRQCDSAIRQYNYDSDFLKYQADCKDCAASSKAVIGTAVIGILTTLPTIMTDFQRSTRAGDLNCQKFMALLTGFLGGMSSLVALIAYAEGCFNFGDNVKGGPGFQLQVIGTVFKFLNIFFHLALKTPPYKRGEEDGGQL